MEEIQAKVLNVMKDIAKEYCGQDVTKVVITVPAYFDASQKEATKDACTIAGLKCMRVINEPTAAMMACGFHLLDEDKATIVVDLGGGTFDVSIACINEGVIDVLAVEGDNMLGGRDLDEALVTYCIEEFKKEKGIDLTNNKIQRNRLSIACEIAKISLCEASSYNLHMDTVEGQDLDI